MSQQQENTSHDNAIAWLFLLLVLGGVIYVIWEIFHVQIRDIARWSRYLQMHLIQLGIDGLGLFGIEADPKIEFNGQKVSFSDGYKDTPRFSAENLTYGHLSYFTALSMQILKYPYSIILCLMAFWALFFSPKAHFRKVMNIDSLIARQAQIFPIVSPMINFNPANVPPRPPGAPVPAELPLFAEALGPEEWLAYNEIQAPDGNLDEAALEKAFIKQLGPRWTGVQNIEPYKQILMAAFCLKASRKRSESDVLLGRLARCWDYKKGLRLSRDRKLLKDARRILKNKKLSELTLENANKHAFETTALLRGLTTAREEGGVLAPAQFLWLRGHNRLLWYCLNNLGRHCFHPDALGAMSHYKQEKMTDRPIPVPKVQDAIETIQEYMASDIVRPIPQLDYSGSKKRGVKKAV